MKYKLCASIAKSTASSMHATLQKALNMCDYAELRLDFLKPTDVPKALEMCKRRLPRTVCTVRPKSEGGAFSGTEKERISVLKLVSEYGPFLLDVEYSTLAKNPKLAKYVSRTKTQVLASWHDFKKTPDPGALALRMSKMAKKADYVKIVTTAKKPHDAAAILSLYSLTGKNLVAFAMGDAGKISRLLSLYLGSPFTYVSLGKPVAPGQFSARQLLQILNGN